MPSPLGRVAEHSEVGRGLFAPQYVLFSALYRPLPSGLTACHLPQRGRLYPSTYNLSFCIIAKKPPLE